MKLSAIALLIIGASAVSLDSHHHHHHHHHHPHHHSHHSLAQGPIVGDCEGSLKSTEKELKRQMEMFSRGFDKTHYDNATKILGSLKAGGFKGHLPRVTTWELYDKSFTWPKIRQYESV